MLRSAYRSSLGILVAIVLSVLWVQNASASSVVVTPPNTTPCKGLAGYPTISQAVSSVPAGSTIYVCPGTYAEQVFINKKIDADRCGGKWSHRRRSFGSQQSRDCSSCRRRAGQ